MTILDRIQAEWGSSKDERASPSIELNKLRKALTASAPPPAILIRGDQLSTFDNVLQPPETPPELDPDADVTPLLARVLPLTEEELLAVEATEAAAAGVTGQYEPPTRHKGWAYGAPVYVDPNYVAVLRVLDGGKDKDKDK